MTSVKVAVRVRPFNQREKDAKSVSIVRMDGSSTYIKNPEDGTEKEYAFDYSYWSHDGYIEPDKPGGYLNAAPGSNYDDQDKVFQDLGVEVLNNAFQGYNACLFAYGQTGSGKSYSIVGYGDNKGIIPRACEEIFNRINKSEQDPNESTQYQVVVSMIEIYNEKVQDLIIKPNKRPKDGLQVREHPKKGVYVEGAQFTPVSSYIQIQGVIDDCTSNRTIGSTNMNATSSRAHTVTNIVFKQKKFLPDGKPGNELTSNINLIDLAGSERAASTGAQGDRLKEGANINKSLMILGKVITALANKGKGIVIPYRESKLTYILKPFLGGNARTSMIAAVSPASINFDESVSTLRYAWQVKAIKNEAKINESPQDKMIRELREEIEKLKSGGATGGGGVNNEEMEKAMAEQKRLMEEMEQERLEFEAKLAEQKQAAEARSAQDALLKSTPQIRNINQDPAMSGMVKIAMKEGDNIAGKGSDDIEPDIKLSGAGIAQIQSRIVYNSGDRVSQIVPNEDDNEKHKVTINGELLTEPRDLVHGDRILYGNHIYFQYIDPLNEEEVTAIYEDAMAEANKDAMNILNQENDVEERLREMEEKMKADAEAKEKELEEARQKLEEDKKNREEILLKQQEEMQNAANEEMQQQMEDELEKAREEFRRKIMAQEEALEMERKRAKEDMERQIKEQIDEQNRIQQFGEIHARLQEIVPKISEINTICGEIGRENVYYEPEIKIEVQDDGSKISKIAINVFPNKNDRDDKAQLNWDTFADKIYFDVKELYEDFEEQKLDPALVDKEYDGEIFGWDLADQWHLIGNTYHFLLSVYNLINTNDDVSPIINNAGNIHGKMKYSVNIAAFDEDDKMLNLMDFDSMEDLLGKKMKIYLDVKQATGIPEKYSYQTKVQYDLFEGQERFETNVIEKQKDPNFAHRKEISIDVTEDMLAQFKQKTLTMEVYGKIQPKRNLNKDDTQEVNQEHHKVITKTIEVEASDDNQESSRNTESFNQTIVQEERVKNKVLDPRIQQQEEKIKQLLAEMELLKEQHKNAKCNCPNHKTHVTNLNVVGIKKEKPKRTCTIF